MISRFYQDLSFYTKNNHVLLLFGPRQAGKTTLLKHFLTTVNEKYKLETGDNIRIQALFGSLDFDQLIAYAQGYNIIAIDEAQEIPNIGKALKILVDNIPNIKIIATGSSSFDLAQNVGEPLTGRKRTITLFPIAQLELASHYNRYELSQLLPEFLIFGSYPAVLNASTPQEKITVLAELVDSYLFKDILSLDNIKNPTLLLNLVKLLAFQIGQLVSLNELATQLAVSIKVVARYIDLLEKSFVITKLSGLSSNLRNEITSKHKYYFLDLGIRNALISHFNQLDTRNDVGQLWENFFIIERIKSTNYKGFYGRRFFYRNYQGQEIDYIEECEQHYTCFEAKWSTHKKASVPSLFQEAFPQSTYSIITPDNYLDFVL